MGQALSVKHEAAEFIAFMSGIKEINFTEDYYNKISEGKRNKIDMAAYYPHIHGAIGENIKNGLAGLFLLFACESSKLADNIMEEMNYLRENIQFDFNEKNLSLMKNMMLESKSSGMIPNIFDFLGKLEKVFGIKYKGLDASEAFLKILTQLVENYLPADKTEALDFLKSYRKEVTAYIVNIKKEITFEMKYSDLARRAATEILSRDVDKLKSIDIEGDMWIPHLDYMARNIAQSIQNNINLFNGYIGSMLYSDRQHAGFGNKPNESFDLMYYANMHADFNYNFYKELMDLYAKNIKGRLNAHDDAYKKTKELTGRYLKMLRSEYKNRRKNKTISGDLYKKINNFIVFVRNNGSDDTSEIFEGELEAYLLYLSSFYITDNSGILTKLSQREIELLEYILGIDYYDAKKAIEKYNREYAGNIRTKTPDSLTLVVGYDGTTHGSSVLTDLLINIYDELGRQYLECISKNTSREMEKHEKYIRCMKNFVKKNKNHSVPAIGAPQTGEVMPAGRKKRPKKSPDEFTE